MAVPAGEYHVSFRPWESDHPDTVIVDLQPIGDGRVTGTDEHGRRVTVGPVDPKGRADFRIYWELGASASPLHALGLVARIGAESPEFEGHVVAMSASEDPPFSAAVSVRPVQQEAKVSA